MMLSDSLVLMASLDFANADKTKESDTNHYNDQ